MNRPIEQSRDGDGRLTYDEGAAQLTTTYVSNPLNQYYEANTEPGTGDAVAQHLTYDEDGNLAEAYIVGDMNCDGVLNTFDVDHFVQALTDPEGYIADHDGDPYPPCDIMNADINGDGVVNSFDNDAFVALLTGGNAAKYVRYTWDAGTLDTALRPKAAGRDATGPQRGRAESRENRLTAVEPAGTPAEGDKKATCVYDYLGRRIEKRAWTYQSGAWTLPQHRKFVWSGWPLTPPRGADRAAVPECRSRGGVKGWLMLMELDGTSGDAILRKYTWGLDLAGLMGSAGVPPANVASGAPAGRLDHTGLGGPALQGAGGTLDRTSFRQGQVGGLLAVQQAQHGGPVLPKSVLGEAITYAFNQWDALAVYTTDGDLANDNNASENALRRVALRRRNWLFCGSDHGGHTAAVFLSLLATCQRHKVEPFTDLRDVLTRIAAHPVSRLAELLPGRTPPA